MDRANTARAPAPVSSGSPIRADELRPWLRSDALQASTDSSGEHERSLPVGMSLSEVERRMILATLEQFDGHRAKTAEALGIGLRTFSGKLRD